MMEQEDGFVGPVNLGNPDEFSIRELAEQVIELCGSDSTLVQEPLPEDDPVRRRPDITLPRAERDQLLPRHSHTTRPTRLAGPTVQGVGSRFRATINHMESRLATVKFRGSSHGVPGWNETARSGSPRGKKRCVALRRWHVCMCRE
jgi:hypothetical protein